MELIDRKAFVDKYLKYLDNGLVCKNVATEICESHGTCVECIIDTIPLIDAVPVVRGHWEDCELIDGKDLVALGYKRCSICHDVGFLNEDAYGYWNGQTLTDFCPNCGADMKEVKE